MQRRQWNTLSIMFMIFVFVTLIAGVQAVGDDTAVRLFGYFSLLWFIVAITCFICGRLEEEEAE